MIYNKAIDRKKGNDEIADLPPLRGRDVKALSPEVEAQRRRIAERKAQEKAEREAMLAEENRRKSQRIAEARARGRDAKSLDEHTELLRQKVAAESRAKKEAREAQIARENAALARRRAEVAARGRDAKALDEKTLADRRAVAERRRLEKEAREAQLAEENQRMRERIAAGKAQGRDVLVDIAGFEDRDRDFLDAGCRQMGNIAGVEDSSFPETSVADSLAMHEHGAFGLRQGHGTELHALCSTWVIWAMIEIAISAGLLALIASPTGA